MAKNKKIETSKLIVWASYAIAIALSLVVIIGTFLGFEVSDITTIAALVWAEVAVSNRHYFQKASKENVLKIAKKIPEEYKDQVDINQLLNE